jgi:DNA-binding MarR family transcriptional regulator
VSDPESTVGTHFPSHYLREAYLRRFPEAAVQRLETVFTLKTVSQQITNVLNQWLEGTTGSPARFQTLALLWGAGDRLVPHQEIIAALQVKRATVSALMFSLEQDGLVQSVGDEQDRRRLLATLTEKGREVITSALELNAVRLANVFSDLAPDELRLLQGLLLRMRDGFFKVASEQGDSI